MKCAAYDKSRMFIDLVYMRFVPKERRPTSRRHMPQTEAFVTSERIETRKTFPSFNEARNLCSILTS